MSGKTAFVCTTPFQLMNMINYISTKNIKQADLFIRTETEEMKRYARNARECYLFSKVHEFVFYGLSQQNRIKKIKWRSIEYFNPAKGIKGCLIDKKDSIDVYDIIVTGSPDTFTLMLYAINPSAEIDYIDDGTGSYHGNIGTNLLTIKGRILQMILGRGPEKLKPSKLILYKPDLCTNIYKAKIEKLLPIDTDNEIGKKALQMIFNQDNNSLDKKMRMVYLAQPAPVDSNTEQYAKTREKEIFSLSEEFGDEILLRPHPRERGIKSYKLGIDSSEYPWELSCMTNIDENTILIGSFSSAMMTPKMLYDKEPFIIFTYMLYKGSMNSHTYIEVDDLINRFAESYKNKKKIFYSSSNEETIETVRKIHCIIQK